MVTHDANAKSADTGRLDATISGYGLAYSIAVLFNAVLTVLKETYPGLHDLMVAITGHHWVTQGALDIIVFVGLGVIFARSGRQMSGPALVQSIVGSTVIGGLIIVGYFLI